MSIADDYAEIAKRMKPDKQPMDIETLLKEVQSHFEESDWNGLGGTFMWDIKAG